MLPKVDDILCLENVSYTWPVCWQVACVVSAPFVDGDSNTIFLLGNSSIVNREVMKTGFPLGEHFVELLFNLSIRFNGFQLHDTEKALFSALVLVSPGIGHSACF